jgi:hypothetical protein
MRTRSSWRGQRRLTSTSAFDYRIGTCPCWFRGWWLQVDKRHRGELEVIRTRSSSLGAARAPKGLKVDE